MPNLLHFLYELAIHLVAALISRIIEIMFFV